MEQSRRPRCHSESSATSRPGRFHSSRGRSQPERGPAAGRPRRAPASARGRRSPARRCRTTPHTRCRSGEPRPHRCRRRTGQRGLRWPEATDASAAVARQPVHGVGGYRGRAPVSGRRRHGALRDHPEPSLGPQGGQRERLDAGRLARGPAPEAAAPDVGGASELHEQAAGRHGAGHAWGSAGALLALCRAGDVVQPAVPLATGLRKHEVQDVHRRTREQITGVRGAHLATDRRFIRLRRPARRHYVRAAGDALSGPEEFDFQRYGCDACLAVHRHIVQEAVHQKCPDDLHRGHHRVFTGRGATDVFVAVAQIVLAWRKGPR
mmetsp:Transcript_30700/g.102170  ORF Transcript_30700/g.102170 Transcript_30700/m.102170 type:complete len:322 (+) Transcript_30700:4702-5667(+)